MFAPPAPAGMAGRKGPRPPALAASQAKRDSRGLFLIWACARAKAFSCLGEILLKQDWSPGSYVKARLASGCGALQIKRGRRVRIVASLLLRTVAAALHSFFRSRRAELKGPDALGLELS